MTRGSADRPASGRVGPVLCPVVVSRRSELAVLDDILAAAREGRGGVVVLVGEAGIGKSRLCRETEVRAQAMAMRTLRGRAAPSAAPVPFRPLAEAVAPAFRRGGIASDPGLEPYRGALRALLPESESAGVQPNRFLLFEAATQLLCTGAGEQGLLLVLEDLHWSDGDTVEFIDYLSDNLQGARIACLCTMRDDPSPPLEFAEALAARRAATLLRLGRLSPDEVAEMVRASIEIDAVPQTLLEMLTARAEGVPFVVEEMLSAYAASGGEVAATATLPQTFRGLVRAHLDALDAGTRQIVSAAAVIGRRFEWSLLTEVTGLDRQEVLDGLRRAMREQLVVAEAGGFEMPFGFRHALVREAVVAELLPPERAELSAAAAAVIEDRFQGLPGEWCERAADLREAAGDGAGAARHLQEAARRALVRGALASVESMLERARALVAADRWHTVGIDRQLVEVLSLAGKTDRLREIGAVALAFVQEKRSHMPFITLGLGDLHLRLARGFVIAGDDTMAGHHLEQARAFAAQAGEKRLLASVRVFEAERALARGEAVAALAAADEAARAAEGLGLTDIRTEVLSVGGRAAFLAGDVERALATLRRACDEAAAVSRIGALLDLGEVQSCLTGEVEKLQEARGLAVSAGAVSSEARADLLIGSALVARFDLDAARDALVRCIEACGRYRLALRSDALAVEAQRLALAGSESDAQAAIGEAGAAPLARAVLALLREDQEGARQALADAYPDPVAEALASLLAAVRLETPPTVASAHAVAVGLGSFGDAVRAAGHNGAVRFAEADAMLERFPWWRHLARRLTSEAALNGGWGDPAAWSRESLAFFEAAGHDRIASACKALLRRAGAPVPRKGRGEAAVPAELGARGVTSREMDVLHLVGEGFGNREIATRLFVSPRTVETHVASLMRKLGTADRAALVAAAAAARTP